MVATGQMLKVLDPTAEAAPAKALIAPRPSTLGGKRLGLLANGKRNSDELLDMVHQILADRYEFRRVVARNKGNASRPCPQEMLEDLVAAAVNDAVRRVEATIQERMSAVTAGMALPPGLKLF